MSESNANSPKEGLLVRALSGLIIVLMAALVLDVLWGVGSRWLGNLNTKLQWGILPNGQAQWTEELARFLLVWVAMFGSALGFSKRAHIGIDWLIDKFHPGTRPIFTILARLIVITFTAVVLLYGGWQLTSRTFASGQMTPALGIPRGFVYLAVPLSGCFILIQSVRDLLSPRTPSDTP
ncbi:MAG: TRAP transporter small permease [Verrucomicrobiae bacterium]|nr:TRAP transporter small permease [Verrucomicrobiae bacterium]